MLNVKELLINFEVKKKISIRHRSYIPIMEK